MRDGKEGQGQQRGAGPADTPYYLPTGAEVSLFEHAARNRLPVLIKGPTGCG